MFGVASLFFPYLLAHSFLTFHCSVPFMARTFSAQTIVQSVSSLISSGTELKIFKGLFDDASLDVNIKGMESERMAYPLAYGYSLVGRVVACGIDVDEATLLGKVVFTFSPHATHVIADVTSLHIVPDGIAAEDAIFMPSVETALSLVHDAHVRVGENVAVYGQGLIGLLVTAILSMHHSTTTGTTRVSSKFGTLSVFDTLPDRLAAASEMGASQALLPTSAASAGPFDVSIEISGNPRALQSAIDYTSNGGRIIVGSWYGNKDVALHLGIDFHRSHKTIQTSQVSTIAAPLQGLWSKERRFALAWELVQQIRPSKLLTKRVSLNQAQEAYEALDKGTEIAVAFDYLHTTR
jgi:threonine dehydrogenase-like Zn-dependent dehydrogenase